MGASACASSTKIEVETSEAATMMKRRRDQCIV
jgi:hypothetical protein